MEKKNIYLDYASTTYVANEVLQEMMPCFHTFFGNPSSVHTYGRNAEGLVDRARDRVAGLINAKSSSEIYFTSGGTEADNWAIIGLARANATKGKHIITSKIEHHAVLEACSQLEKEGFEITYLDVDANGLVKISELLHYLRNDTILVSIMSVNNEVGTIQNIKTIGKICREYDVIFHTDAVQAVGVLKMDVQDMEIDALSISSHKIYGPKGVGALYVRNGVRISPLHVGGSQERNLRGGTLNVPGIVGFGKACELTSRNLTQLNKHYKSLRTYFVREIKNKLEFFKINGHPQQKANSILNMSVYGVDGESLLMLLDLAGIAVSTGSACTAKSSLPSHVLQAMGIPVDVAQSSIRISFGKTTTKQDLDIVIEELVKAVESLRSISPIKPKKVGGNEDV